jgi:hypothetical protein
MHTAEVSNCSFAPAAKHVEAYKKAGYIGIIITDHLASKTFKFNKGAIGSFLLQPFIDPYS